MPANVSQQMFPSLPTVGNITKHRQETMFPSLPRALLYDVRQDEASCYTYWIKWFCSRPGHHR